MANSADPVEYIVDSNITLPHESVHEISNNVVCATNKDLIRAFASRLSIL